MSSGSVEEVDVSAPVGRQVLEEPLSDSARACVGHVSPADDSAVLLEADADAGLQEDGVELEQDDPDGAAAEHPFDPSKIKVRTISVVVDQLVKRVEFKEIDLAPDFQRLKGIWKARDKSRLIESLLLRIPIPVFYVSADEDDHWSVVDGVQRISTITDFIAGAFPVTDLEYREAGPAPSWPCKVTPENEKTIANRRLSQARTFRSTTGTRQTFEWHARFGSGGRIHLRFEAKARVVEIGYIGRHLPL